MVNVQPVIGNAIENLLPQYVFLQFHMLTIEDKVLESEQVESMAQLAISWALIQLRKDLVPI